MEHKSRALREGETAIRPTFAHQRRAALAAGAGVGVVIVPFGLVVALLTHDWSLIPLCVFVTLLVMVASFIGQSHNQVFVGPRGLRREARDCDLIAPWESLTGLEVRVPGNRIVVFNVLADEMLVERRSTGRSNRAESLVRHPPEGFDLRLDRHAADTLVTEISRRRPDLEGLKQWEKSSRPTTV
jgi:hypothetical protein